MVYVVADHGGFKKKQLLLARLRRRGLPVRDLGPASLQTKDDYPIWAARLARLLQSDRRGRGLALCRSGVGMAIAANKFPGLRAVQGWSVPVARASRREENSNLLSLAADHQSLADMERIVMTWWQTPYRPVKRFQRRLREISRLEHER